jgi:hypothetical protein
MTEILGSACLFRFRAPAVSVDASSADLRFSARGLGFFDSAFIVACSFFQFSESSVAIIHVSRKNQVNHDRDHECDTIFKLEPSLPTYADDCIAHYARSLRVNICISFQGQHEP